MASDIYNYAGGNNHSPFSKRPPGMPTMTSADRRARRVAADKRNQSRLHDSYVARWKAFTPTERVEINKYNLALYHNLPEDKRKEKK